MSFIIYFLICIVAFFHLLLLKYLSIILSSYKANAKTFISKNSTYISVILDYL